MFARLFATSGLSLDRLRALVEVGAWGSIARAVGSDPARQSQYSRQIKELESFFQADLVERHGNGIRLTPKGRELARISRFFLLGLSNFQRGCLAEGQVYRIAAPPTCAAALLLPVLAKGPQPSRVRFRVEVAAEADIERRLQELNLDFGIVLGTALSRPLQVEKVAAWQLSLWVPRNLCPGEKQAVRLFAGGRLPVVWPAGEMAREACGPVAGTEPALECSSFVECQMVLASGKFAALLPDFLRPDNTARFWRVRTPELDACRFEYGLAWNPRLSRLNPHALRRKDELVRGLAARLSALRGEPQRRVGKNDATRDGEHCLR